MRLRTLPLLALAALAPAAFAQPLDAGQSQIGFTLKQLNVPMNGQFKQFSGSVNFDPAKPQAGSPGYSFPGTLKNCIS